MRNERYELETESDAMVFEFTSVGLKGRIPKLVIYSETNVADVYNLGFGDKDMETGDIDDMVITDNKDSPKVLATVASTVYAFTYKKIDMKEMIKELNAKQVPIVKINEGLKAFKDSNLFGKKLERMNDILLEGDLPEAYFERNGLVLGIPIDRVNHDLDKYDSIDFFPEKTKQAKEMLAKWGLPKGWEEDVMTEEREQALCVNGTLSHADLDTNTFLIVVEATDNAPQTRYTVTAVAAVLKKLVKDYWGDLVKVYIKPKGETTTPLEYELVEVG